MKPTLPTPHTLSSFRARSFLGPVSIVAAVAIMLVLASAPAAAQQTYTYSLNLMAGFGGSLDEDSAGFGNQSFQLGLSLHRPDQVQVGVRVGSIQFDTSDRIGDVFDPELSYFSIGGEYRFLEDYYESGLFVGLGFYELDGRFFDGAPAEESTIGLVLGATGEFQINRRVGFLVELAGHFTPLDAAEFFGTLQGGLTVHF